MCLFILMVYLKIFFFSVLLSNLIMMCLVSFMFPVLGVHWASQICGVIHFIILRKIVRNPYACILCHLKLFCGSQKSWIFFFPAQNLFCIFLPGWFILLLGSWIFSSVIANLLFLLASAFFLLRHCNLHFWKVDLSAFISSISPLNMFNLSPRFLNIWNTVVIIILSCLPMLSSVMTGVILTDWFLARYISISYFPLSLHDLQLFVFWLCCTACGILLPRPGIEPVPPAVEVQSPNHWTAREFPCNFWLDTWQCDFYLVGCWMFWYVYKYSWALFWVSVKLLELFDSFRYYFEDSFVRSREVFSVRLVLTTSCGKILVST